MSVHVLHAMICQLVIDPPAAGPWNMAVDEVLLMAAAEEGVATLRLYQWSEPTLSLGYFQRYGDRQRHAASRSCAVVRRQTGGGAILHDRELTYSLALPASHPMARQNEQLYMAVHQAVSSVLMPAIAGGDQAWTLELRASSSALGPAGEPFLCFARQARGDLLLLESAAIDGSMVRHAESKILGSAQRRHRGAILQHGGLLLATSSAAPELLGLRELTGAEIEIDQLSASLPPLFGDVLQLETHNALLSNEMRQTAARIEATKYGHSGWTKRR
jgi:lipoyl(octanoyl) transferase